MHTEYSTFSSNQNHHGPTFKSKEALVCFTSNLNSIESTTTSSTTPAIAGSLLPSTMSQPASSHLTPSCINELIGMQNGPLSQKQYWQTFILSTLNSFGYWDNNSDSNSHSNSDTSTLKNQETPTSCAVQKTLDYLESSANNLPRLAKTLIHDLSKRGVSSYQGAILTVLNGLNEAQVPSRFDRRETGLQQTHILEHNSKTLFALCKKFPIKSNTADLQHLGLDMSRNQGRCLTKGPDGQHQLVFGQGHFGRVYAARRLADQQLTAVKVIREILPSNDVAQKEIENHRQLQHVLAGNPEALSKFSPLTGHAEAISHGLHKSYLFQPILKEKPFYSQIKLYHRLPVRDTARKEKLSELAVTLLDLTKTLETHELCHPDFKPDNIIDGKMIDLGDLWFGNLGQLHTRTTRYFPPKHEHSFIMNGNRFFSGERYRGVSRFLCGVSLFETVIGCTPKDLATQSLDPLNLSLPFSRSQQTYRHGFQHSVTPSINPRTGNLLTSFERVVLTIALLMMVDRPSDRLAPATALAQLQRFE